MIEARLSDIAKRLVLPANMETTEWPSVRDACSDMGIRFEQWQADLIACTLCKDSRGIYCSTVGGVGWSLPRQVGKTFTLGGLLFALAREIPGLLVLWTAHHTKTTAETFSSMQSMAARPKVKPYIDRVLKGAGTEAVVFKNGSRILFGARDRGFGLGFAGVDVIVFDEAQRLSEQTRVDMVPAANRPTNPAGALIFYIGTPPRPTDRGDAFTEMRDSAKLDGDTLWVELGADDDAESDDRDQWAKANPSYPHFTPEESMLRMRKHLGDDDSWKREALGIWDPVGSRGVMPGVSWAEQADVLSVPLDRFTLGVEVGPDLKWASVSLAGSRLDGWHVELDEDQHTKGRGIAWLVPYLRKTLDLNPGIRAVIVDVGGPIAALLIEKKQKASRGQDTSVWHFKDDPSIRVQPVRVVELGTGCANLLSGIVTGIVWHLDQPQMNSAALTAQSRALGDSGMWVWHRASAESDITQVQSATLALIGAQKDRVKSPHGSAVTGRRATTERRRAVIL